MMKRRLLSLVTMMAVLCCIFTATAEEPIKSRTITLLTHASLDTPSELSGVIGGLIEEYKQLHPEFNLEYEVVGLTNIVGKVKTLAADRKSTRLNSSHIPLSRMPSSA